MALNHIITNNVSSLVSFLTLYPGILHFGRSISGNGLVNGFLLFIDLNVVPNSMFTGNFFDTSCHQSRSHFSSGTKWCVVWSTCITRNNFHDNWISYQIQETLFLQGSFQTFKGECGIEPQHHHHPSFRIANTFSQTTYFSHKANQHVTYMSMFLVPHLYWMYMHLRVSAWCWVKS